MCCDEAQLNICISEKKNTYSVKHLSHNLLIVIESGALNFKLRSYMI